MPSTVIRSIHYNEAKELLVVEFVSGLVYHYMQVPPSVYNAFKNSKMKGVYFNEHIRDQFSFKRIHTDPNLFSLQGIV
ncbi:MAG TPA: KTSC domain-containing protein [Niabella sp.]|nr:KTSC domain-containing protein [Niabella sp.]